MVTLRGGVQFWRRPGAVGVSTVPQATLPRIREMVDLVAAGNSTAEQISGATATSGRQILYGVAAAVTLGLLVEDGPKIVLSDLGTRLAATPRNSDEEAALLREVISLSDVMTRIAPGLFSDSPPSREVVTKNIASFHDGLGEETPISEPG